jgi:methyl-accepting chemotaxis protein
MFKTMKLGSKIVAGFAAVTFIAVIIGFIGVAGMRSMQKGLDEVADNRLPSVQSLLIMNASTYMLYAVERGLINRRLVDPQFRKAQYDLADKAVKKADAAWKVYEPLPQTKEEATIWKEFVPHWDAWKKSHQLVISGSEEKDRLMASGADLNDARMTAVDDKVFEASTESRKKFLEMEVPLAKLVELNVRLASEANAAADAQGSQARVQMIAAIVVAVLLAIGIGFYLKRNIAAILKELVDESGRLSEAAVNGKLLTRGDLQRINFEFRGVLEGMNQTLDAVVGPLNVAAEYVDRISKGDVPPKITDSYNGDFNEIKNNLNVLIEAMEEVTGIAEKIALGDLAVQVTPRSKGDQLMLAMKDMVEQLKGLAQSAEGIAAGDLTVIVEPASDRDVMGNAFVAMIDNLREIVGNVNNSTGSIATASRQIAAGNTDLAQRTEEQAASLEETAASMEELTSTVKQNADNSQQANQLAIVASDVAVKGGSVIEKVVVTMDSISDSSKKIADIIGVIDGIAFQTNILALNAAVEAARAGEQGRGFAVVAGEVRNLAQRSAAAAKEIKSLISDSVGKVDSGSKLVGEAGQTMREIVTSIKRVTDIMGEISAASLEQSTGIEQVNIAVTTMDEMTQQNSAVVQQASSAADSLEEQAQLLVEAVSRFKLEDSRNIHGVEKRSEAPLHTLKLNKPSKAQAKKAGGSVSLQKRGNEQTQQPMAKAVGDDTDWNGF